MAALNLAPQLWARPSGIWWAVLTSEGAVPIPHGSINSSSAKRPHLGVSGEEHIEAVTPMRLLMLFVTNPNKEVPQITENCQLLPCSCSLWAFICGEGLLLLCATASLSHSLSLGKEKKSSAIQSLVLMGLNYSPHSIISCLGRNLASPSLVFRPVCRITSFINKPSPALNFSLGFPTAHWSYKKAVAKLHAWMLRTEME